jgi:Dolichyl-phosphate-mannose-protein mannosyltransferase
MTAASVRMIAFGRHPPPSGLAVAAVLVAVIVPAAALRLEAAGDRPGHASADERAYVQLASDLRASGNYGNPTMAHPLHWAPGAPALFALADAVDGHATSGGLDRRAARRAQAIVGALTVAAAFGLAALIANAWAGIAAAIAVAFYPPMIAATSHLTSELLGALAVTAALVAVVWAWGCRSAPAFATSGAAVGLACLVRADVLLAALALGPAVGALHARRAGWREGILAGALTLAGVLVIVGPWSAWASRREHVFVPITDGAATTLFVGTYLPGHGTIFGLKHSLAQEVARVHPSIQHEPLFRVSEKVFLDAVAARHPHMSRNAAIAAEARHNLRVYLLGHPIAFGRMVAGKVWRMWGFPFRGSFGRKDAATLWLHRALLVLALIGVLAGLALRRSAPIGLVLVVLGITAVVDVAFVAEARHAFRLLPALVGAGAAGWALVTPALWSRVRARSARSGSSRQTPGSP